MDRSAVAFEEHKKIIDKMEAALQSESAKNIRYDLGKHVDQMLNPNEISPADAAEDDASLDRVKRNIGKDKEAKARQEEKARRAAMEAAKQAQANEETAQAENENVAAESADNFNVNY